MKDLKILLSVGFALLLIYAIAEYNRPKPVNWRSSMYYLDKIPFGTYALYQQLAHIYPGSQITKTNQPIYNALHHTGVQGNYFVLSNSISLGKADYHALVDYLKAGNNVFIAAYSWEGTLADTLNLDVQAGFAKGNLGLNFTNLKLKQAKPYHFEHDISNSYFSSFDTAHAVVLSRNTAGKSNYLRFSFGKGNLYLCANPHLFTNYSLLTPQGADYAAKALSYLPTTANLYWDEYQNHDIPEDDSPLRVLFSHESLKWAYYISLLTTLIFVVFEIKRRQRVIPIADPLQNTTLDFVRVVGQVYYESRDNSNIARKKITYLLEHWRTWYNLKTQALNREFTDLLAQKAGLAPDFALELVTYINYIHPLQRVTDAELIELNQLIEKYYTLTGLHGKRTV
ncbi:DUF4350 domain-containing protein [Mucilaginibacter robiniae]|uniref:DUF4350 domain-containing protein n=1 Tax=Mucilaginibacter robiniae TaxID=2728022 RepID=A0A7L5E2T6_9SPHI|nr:DUF4350 domain-containing protein [Mucilaginibacter robiniae]QJD96747.1 DUF4350 domain-containing protein [Mucilaginibacter robiniae]